MPLDALMIFFANSLLLSAIFGWSLRNPLQGFKYSILIETPGCGPGRKGLFSNLLWHVQQADSIAVSKQFPSLHTQHLFISLQHIIYRHMYIHNAIYTHIYTIYIYMYIYIHDYIYILYEYLYVIVCGLFPVFPAPKARGVSVAHGQDPFC